MSHSVFAPPTEPARPRRLLDLKSGWPLWISLVIVLGAIVWRAPMIIDAIDWQRGLTPGRGAANGFDLSTLIVPLDRVTPSGLALDGLKALVIESKMKVSPTALQALRPRFLVPSDRVLGVTLADESRAYPIRILNWHEVVLDTLGGIPIAVTYCPLSDSARVFDRRGDGGETLELRFSGLLMNSSLLMYDVRPDLEDSSLWSQMEERAISGPAGARAARLETFPCVIVPYGVWKEHHPETTVIEGHPFLYRKCYGQECYDPYFQAPGPTFPVAPLPPADGPALMERVLTVRENGAERDLFVREIAERANGSGEYPIEGTNLIAHYQPIPECAWLTQREDGTLVPTDHALWFALYAARNGDATARPAPAALKTN